MAELMAVRVAPAGPASWCSSCGEWVAPTLERFAGGPTWRRPCPAVVAAAAAAHRQSQRAEAGEEGTCASRPQGYVNAHR